MSTLHLIHPTKHGLFFSGIRLRSSVRILPQLNHRARFSTSLLNLNQSRKLLIDSKQTLVQPKPIPLKAENVEFKPRNDISTEIYTVPNMLTFTRIAATPFIGYFLATGQTKPAIALFTYSCVTDFVDGILARNFGMKSVLGSILDPAADKFLMTTCTVALAIPGVMPLYVASAIIGRDVMLSFISFYVRYKALPPPVTISRYLDLSITTHTVHPNLLGKVNTALQMFYIGGLVLKPVFESFWALNLSETFDWFGMLVAASTILSGLSYIVGKHSFKSALNSPSTKS